MTRWWPLAVAAVAVAAVLLVVALVSGGKGALPRLTAPPASRADPVPYDGRSPLQAPGSEQRVLVQFARPALGDLPNARAMGAADQLEHIKSLKREASATRSALEARGVRLHDVVGFYRVWNGFAATVSTKDLAQLNSRGVRVRSVRRAYPASGEPVPVPGSPAFNARPDAPTVAVLDTGVDTRALHGHAQPGYDAVDRDRKPAPGKDPGGGKREETSGTALAGIVAQAGLKVLPIRIASLQAVGGGVEASTTTDRLIAGLEHAVDPNGDGDTSDHVPVALVGVNAPYAGFSHSPEAQAVAGAGGLGTLVVAPAGNEGAGAGTIGSPGAAPDALAVGALTGSEPAPRTALELSGDQIADAAVLAGRPPASGTTAGPVQDTRPAVIGRQQTRLRGHVVVVKAGANPAAQAAAAAAVGATAVVLAQPGDRPLPAIAAGRARAPVVGVTGDAAQDVLRAKPGTKIAFGAATRGQATDAPAGISPATAQGPSAGGRPKPDLAAPGSALTVGVGGGAVVIGGTAVAAARVAVAAAELAHDRPELSPAQLRANLIAHAAPENLPPDRAGAGAVQPGFGTVTSDPPSAVSDPLNPVAVKLTSTATTPVTLRATSGAPNPAGVTLTAGAPSDVSIRLAKPGTTTGRLTVLDGQGRTLASVPWVVRPATVAAVPVGDLQTSAGGRRVTFVAGAFTRGPRTRIEVVEKLVLDLVDAHGAVVRSLTFPGGARELMPAEYGYTLPAGARPGAPYAFRVRAWAPDQKQPTAKSSKLIHP